MKLRYRILNSILLILLVAVLGGGLYISHDGSCDAAPPVSGASTMKAIVYRCYGGPEVLKLETIAKQLPAEGRVLVKVHAASVNPLDWHYMRGKPYVMRPMTGIGVPTNVRMGVDFAGTVEAVGPGVTAYKPGDEVFGGGDGAFAEYVTARAADSIASKPFDVTFEDAAAAPIAAVTALQALRDRGRVQRGQKVLINGASGGVGTYAVQLAKHFGAEVTGVCGAGSVELVSSLGADHVIDYRQTDFTRGTEQYDLIVDMVGSHTLAEYRRAMKRDAILVMVGGSGGGSWLGPLAGAISANVADLFISQHAEFMLSDFSAKDLALIAELMRTGELRSVIDRRFPLDQTPEAVAYVEQGHAHGKVIVTVIP